MRAWMCVLLHELRKGTGRGMMRAEHSVAACAARPPFQFNAPSRDHVLLCPPTLLCQMIKSVRNESRVNTRRKKLMPSTALWRWSLSSAPRKIRRHGTRGRTRRGLSRRGRPAEAGERICLLSNSIRLAAGHASASHLFIAEFDSSCARPCWRVCLLPT